MRNYLGVFAGVAALCVASWAQIPAAPPPSPDQAPPTPTQAPAPEAVPIPPRSNPKPLSSPLRYPRFEFFVGGTYAEAGLFNAGHWAGLSGWDSSLGLNATSWLGVVVEGGQYFGTSKIPQAVPAPFPTQIYEPAADPTFNAATREYNFLFGPQFARRKYARWTPIAELLYGHQGVRGVATPLIAGPLQTEVSSGRALVAGGGLDYKINPRLALRLKADYLLTNTAFSLLGKEKQDNFRVSVGLVIRSVHKKKRTLEDEGELGTP